MLGTHIGGADGAGELQAVQQRTLGGGGQCDPVGQLAARCAGGATELGEQRGGVSAGPADQGLLRLLLEQRPEQVLGVEVRDADADGRDLGGPAGSGGEDLPRVRAHESRDVDPLCGPSWLGRPEEAGEKVVPFTGATRPQGSDTHGVFFLVVKRFPPSYSVLNDRVIPV